MNAQKTIINTLKKNGFRITAIRVALVKIFTKQKGPLSAMELLTKIRRTIPSVDKTTIYREIAFLKEQKILYEVQLGEDKKRFELMTKDHHHHIVCLRCDAVEDVRLKKDLFREEQRIAALKKFKILHHSLEFFGLCTNCQ